MINKNVPNFCCGNGFDPCCQDLHFSDNDWYQYVGRTSLREGVAMAISAGHQNSWFKRYQVSDYEPRRVGDWAIQKFTVDDVGAFLHNHNEIDPGRWIVTGDYTSLVWYGDPEKPKGVLVMSDTPAEIMDHTEFIDKAYGRVLINGLGIGMVAHALLHEDKRECIESIDIVEKNKEVIDLVSHYFKDEPKVTIHCADAFEMEWPEDAYWHCAWHDIWYYINPSDYPQMKQLMKKYRSRTLYQDCWTRRWLLGFIRWERARQEVAA